jgi:hypothetical protein
MKQSATTRTVRSTVHAHNHRSTCLRMRLHLPRRLARVELRAWGDAIEDSDSALRTPAPIEERPV